MKKCGVYAISQYSLLMSDSGMYNNYNMAH